MTEEEPSGVVLSADDDDNAGILLQRAFAKTKVPARLYFVSDGEEVVRYLQGQGSFSDRKKYPFPDLLLLDLKMPKLSGLEAMETIHRTPRLATLPVIMLSSSVLPEDMERAKALGIAEYFVKPASFDALLDIVQQIKTRFLSSRPLAANFEAKEDRGKKTDSPVKRDYRPKSISSGNVSHSPDFFSVLVEQVADYAIFMMDPTGHILSWNEGARRIKGYEASEIVGQHFSKFYPVTDIENDKPGFELRVARETGRYEEEGWRIRKDGARFWANVVITAIRDNKGDLVGFAKVTRDLTQRKIQEENLQRLLESEERFRLLVEQVKDYAIFILDPRGNIISWNQGARRIKGYNSDEIIGKHFSTFYTQEDLATDKPTRELNLAVRDGRYEEESWRVRKDGTRFWANVVITSLWDKRGNLTGFAKVTRDLTDKKREDERLRQKTTELEAFAHTLSHDLRSPLRSIIGLADILKSDLSDLKPEEISQYLSKITDAAQIMGHLIDDILAYSKVAIAGGVMEAVSLREVMNDVLALLENDINTSKADLQVEPDLPCVQGQRTLLIQVFSNLLGNALKFVPRGGRPQVEVFTSSMNGQIDIFVKDNGIGIAPEHREKIFHLFEQLNPKTNFGGTGIGLAIVKKAVERMGGTMRLESQPGRGSTFVVTLIKPVKHQEINSPEKKSREAGVETL